MNTLKRVIAMTLALLMFIQCTPLTALAEGIAWLSLETIEEGGTYYAVTLINSDGTVKETQLVLEKNKPTKPADGNWNDSDFTAAVTGDKVIYAASAAQTTGNVINLGVRLNGEFITLKTVEIETWTVKSGGGPGGGKQTTYRGIPKSETGITYDDASLSANSTDWRYGDGPNNTKISFGTATKDNESYWTVTKESTYYAAPKDNLGKYYTVTFVYKNSEGNEIASSDIVLHNQNAEAPNLPQKVKGYQFKEWNDTLNNITQSKTVTAVYDRTGYVIKFEGSSFAEQRVEEGAKVTVVPSAEQNPTMSGAVFAGWATTQQAGAFATMADAQAVIVDPTTVQITAETTFYPVFVSEKQVTFINGDDQSASVTTTNLAATIPALELDKDGYQFVGWTTDSAKRFADSSTELNIVLAPDATTISNVAADMTYYAAYVSNTYTVNFYIMKEDGSFTVKDTQSVKYNGSVTAPELTAEEQRFTYTDEDGKATELKFVAWHPVIPEKITSSMDFYAQYENQKEITGDTKIWTLIIEYVYENGQTASDPVIAVMQNDSPYYFGSPAIQGYTADRTTVSGYLTADTNIKVTYSPKEGIPYRVLHHQQNVNGSGYTLAESETLYGKAGEMTNAESKGYTGFKAPAITNAAIAGNGKTVINLYYDRAEYTVRFNSNGGTYVPTIFALYGTPLTMPANPERAGYVFKGWDKALPSTMTAEHLVLNANWEAIDVPYLVVYQRQDADNVNKYDVVGSERLMAKTGTPLSSLTGATINKNAVNNNQTLLDETNNYFHKNTVKTDAEIGNGTVSGDGTTIINIYYDRNIYKVVFQSANRNTTYGTIEARYMQALTAENGNEWPMKPSDISGNTSHDSGFNGWEHVNGKSTSLQVSKIWTMTSDWCLNTSEDGITYVKKQEKDNPHSNTVEYYLENVNSTDSGDRSNYTKNDGYSFDVEGEHGFFGAKKIDGFIAQDGENQTANLTQQIYICAKGHEMQDSDSCSSCSWNGRTNWVKRLTRLYYKRLSYALTYYVDGVQSGGQVPYKYQEPLSAEEAENHKGTAPGEGYTFEGWYTDKDYTKKFSFDGATMPFNNMSLFGRWNPPQVHVSFEGNGGTVTITNVDGTVITLDKGSTVTNNIEADLYGFVLEGWYYLDQDDNGNYTVQTDRKFDLSAQIDEDVFVYAKWKVRTDIPYTVRYYESNTEHSVADPKVVEGNEFLSTVTENAITVNGYLLDTLIDGNTMQQSTVLDSELAEENVIIFYYAPRVDTEYTVQYRLASDPSVKLAEDKVVPVEASTTQTVFTETYTYIPGYTVDQLGKSLVLTYNEEDNVITFLYTPRDVLVKVHHLDLATGKYLPIGNNGNGIETFQVTTGSTVIADRYQETYAGYAYRSEKSRGEYNEIRIYFDQNNRVQETTPVTVQGGNKAVLVAGDNSTNLYLYYERLTGDLIIKKTVSGGPSLNDLDGISVTITGPADFTQVTIGAVELSDGTHTIENVPTGVYTITEYTNTVQVTGYTLSASSETSASVTVEKDAAATAELMNVYTRDTGSLKIEKIVKDSTLTGTKNFTFTVTGPNDYGTQNVTVTVTGAGNTSTNSVVLNNLPTGNYTVTETAVEGYVVDAATKTANVIKGGKASVTFTNTRKNDNYSVTATKVWDDASNQDGKRPAANEFVLTLNGILTGDEHTLNQIETGDTWTYTWSGLEEFDANGVKINYTVDEETVLTGYTKTVDNTNMKVTNSYTPETVPPITVTKIWSEGPANPTDVRPENVRFKLYAKYTDNGEEKHVKFEGANNTPVVTNDEDKSFATVPLAYDVTKTQQTATTQAYPKYAFGHELTYYAKEVGAENGELLGKNSAKYTVVENGLSITNTLATAELVINKTATVWTGETTPNSFTFTVNNTAYTATKKSTSENGLTSTYQTDPIVVNIGAQYTIAETGYTIGNTTYTELANVWVTTVTDGTATGTTSLTRTMTASGNEVNFTNTRKLTEDEVVATKVWNDANDQDGKRLDSVTLQIKAGETVLASGEAKAANSWQFSEKVPTHSLTGAEYTHTADEAAVPEGYAKTLSGLTVTNTYVPQKRANITVTKVWNDADNPNRPTSVTVQLKQNGNDYRDAVTLNKDNNWTYTWTDLPENVEKTSATAATTKAQYTVVETALAGYTATYSPEEANQSSYTITNTIDQVMTSVIGTKEWAPVANVARPTIWLQLWSDEVTDSTQASTSKIIELDGTVDENGEKEAWKAEFTDLNTYAYGTDGSARVIDYTVREVDASGNDWTPNGYTKDTDNTDLQVKNTYNAGVGKITVAKQWVTPEGMTNPTARLKLNRKVGSGKGEVVGNPFTTNENGQYEFTGLEEFAPNGEAYTYYVTEDSISEYTAYVNGTALTADGVVAKLGDTVTVVNKSAHLTDTADIVVVTKEWDDDSNYANIRPSKEIFWVKLTGDSKITPTEYIVQNKAAAEGAEAVQMWDGNENTWTYTFDDVVRKYDDQGNIINYTVSEYAAGNYVADSNNTSRITPAANVSTVSLKNSYAPGKVTVTVQKVWVDNNNEMEIRPASVTAVLKNNNGDPDCSQELNEGNNWSASWRVKEFKKNSTTEKITYTVEEFGLNSDNKLPSLDTDNGRTYSAKVEKTDEDGYAWKITNTHDADADKSDIVVTKQWKNGETVNTAPDAATVKVKLQKSIDNGTNYVDVAEGTMNIDNGTYKYIWKNQNKYEKVDDTWVVLKYRVVETHAPTGWEIGEIDGVEVGSDYTATITNNRAKSDPNAYPVQKVWYPADDADKFGITVTVMRKANNVEETYKDVILTTEDIDANNNWTEYLGAVETHDVNGNPYEYYIEPGSETYANEADSAKLDWYTATYDDLTVTNKRKTTSATVTKSLPTGSADGDKFQFEYFIDDVSKDTFWLDANTLSKQIDNLNVGDKLTVKEIKTTQSDETTDVTYYTVDYGEHENQENTAAEIANLSATAESNAITVTNTREPVTSMTLKKIVSDSDHNADQAFNFKYRVNGGEWQTVPRTHADGPVKLTDGLYVGDKVEIAEIEDVDYVFPATTNVGDKTKSTTIGTDQVTLITIDQIKKDNAVVFTNNRKTSGLTVSKTVIKPATTGIDGTATGDAVNTDASTEFTFALKKGELVEANAAYTIGTSTELKYTDSKGQFKLKGGETATFTKLEVGTYTVTETDESDWTVVGEATKSATVATDRNASISFTNTRDTKADGVTVQKIWQDNSNAYGTRPESVTLQIVGKVGDKTVYTADVILKNTDKLDENTDTWERMLINLPQTHGGETIVYTAAEANVPSIATGASVAAGTVYVKSAESGLTVTNTLAGKTDSLKFTKKWNDQDNTYNRRPTTEAFKAMLHLNKDATIEGYTADGSTVTFDKNTKLSVVETSDQNAWTITFTDLPLYTLNGVKYEYTLTEELTGNTASWYTGVDADETWTAGSTPTDTELNNSLNVADITVTKKLIDSTDNANDQTFAITATYDYAHEPVETVTTTQISRTENLVKNGTITFTDIPVGGKLNVSEAAIAGYTVKYYTDENAKADAFAKTTVGSDISVVVENTRVTTERSSEKVWANIDNVNKPEVKISLYAKYTESAAGENEGAATSADKWLVKSGDTVTVAGNETAFVTVDLGADLKNAFTNLPTHTKAGQPITYTIKETMVEVEGSVDDYKDLYTMSPAEVDGNTNKVFTNTRKDIADANNGLKITKTIVNGDREVTEAMKQDKFSFTVTMPADMKGGTMRYKVTNGNGVSSTAQAVNETNVAFTDNTFIVNNVQHDQTVTLMGLVVNGALKPLLTGTYSIKERAADGNTFTYVPVITDPQTMTEATTEASFTATNTVNTGTVKITKKWQQPNGNATSITPYVDGTKQAAADVKAELALKKGDQELVSYEANSSNSMEVTFDVPKDSVEYTIVEKSQNGENYNKSTDVAKVKWNASANNGNGGYEFVGGTDNTIVNLLKRTDKVDSISDEIKIEKSIRWNGTKPENITDTNAFNLTYSYVDTDGETKTGTIKVKATYAESGAETLTYEVNGTGTPVVVENGGGIILDNLAYGTEVTVTEDLGKYSEVWDKTEPDNVTVKAETQTMTVINTRNLFNKDGNITVNKVWLDRLGEQNLADSLKQTVTAVLTGTVTNAGGATYTDKKALESASWTNTFEKVPKADVATGKEYTYAVTEKNAENGKINLTFGEGETAEVYTYDVTVTPESSGTSYTITNQRSGIAVNGVTIKKTVTNGSDDPTTEMQNDSFTFEVTVPAEMEGMTVQYTIGQTGGTQVVKGGKLTFSDIKHNQTITLNGLVDGSKIVALAEGKYSVTESAQATGNKYTYVPTVSPAGMTDIASGDNQAFEVTNSTQKGSFQIKKLWENPNGDGYKTTAFDKPAATVEFTLYTDASCQTALLNNEQPVKAMTADNPETEAVEATATFENIPLRTYYVKETEIVGTDSYVKSEQVLKAAWNGSAFVITDLDGKALDTISNDLKHTTADNGALTITKDIQWKNTADKKNVTFDIGYAYKLPDGKEISGVIKAVATYDENGEETLLYKPGRGPSDAQGIKQIALTDIPYGTTVTFTESPNAAWKPSMSNVTEAKVEGAVIAGTVTTDATNDEVVVTNTRVLLNPDKPEDKQGQIKVTKVWAPNDVAKPASLSVQLLWNNRVKETKLLSADWSAEFTDLPAYDLSGEPYEYTVLEVESDGTVYGNGDIITLEAKKADESAYSLYSYVVTIDDSKESQKSGKFTITNTYKSPEPAEKIAGKDEKTDNLNLGDTISYTIKRTSHLNQKATATIKDVLPKGLTYVNGSAKVDGVPKEPDSKVVKDSGKTELVWNNVPVDELATVTVTYEAKVNVDAITAGADELKNVVEVKFTDEPEDINFQGADETVYTPVLSIAKEIEGSTTVRTNDTVTYTVKVTNSGNADAKGVEIADVIPEGLSEIKVNGKSAEMDADRVVKTMIPVVAAGSSERVTITAKVTALTGTIAKNLVTITEENGKPTDEDPKKPDDPDTPFKDESDELEVKNPLLTVTKIATDESEETDLTTKEFAFVLTSNKGYDLSGVAGLNDDGSFKLKNGESITFELPIDVTENAETIYTIDENETAWNLTFTGTDGNDVNADQKGTVTFTADANGETVIEVVANNVRKMINEESDDLDDDGKLQVTKVWLEANGVNELTSHIADETVKVNLYRSSSAEAVTSTPPRPMELTKAANWAGIFKKLPATDAQGNPYTYTVKEVDETLAEKVDGEVAKFATDTAGELFFEVTIDQENTAKGYTITNKLKDREKDPETTKTADKAEAEIDDVITYTITDVNPYGTTTTATITDTLPNGIAYNEPVSVKIINNGVPTESEYEFVAKDQILTWTIENVPPMSSVKIVFKAKVTEDAVQYDELTNKATISRKDGHDSEFKSDEGTVDVDTLVPDLEMIKTLVPEKVAVEPGETITYRLTVKNTGNGRATGVVVTDYLPEQVVAKLDDAQNLTLSEEGNQVIWNVGVVEAGQEVSVEFAVMVKSDEELDELEDRTQIINNAKITEQPPKDPNDPDAPDEDEVITPIFRVEIDKTSRVIPTGEYPDADNDPNTASLGDIIEFKVTVRNLGGIAADNIVVEDLMLGKAIDKNIVVSELVEKIMIMLNLEENQLILPKLEPGKKVEFTYQYKVTEADILAGSVNNVATVTAQNPDSQDDPIVESDETKNQTDPATPSMIFDKAITNDTGKPYGFKKDIAYMLTITNTGNVSLTDVVIVDDMTSGADPEDRIIELEKPILPGETVTVEYTYTVQDGDLRPTYKEDGVTPAEHPIDNKATVTAMATNDEVISVEDTAHAMAEQWYHIIFVDSRTNEVIEYIDIPYGGRVFEVPEPPYHRGYDFIRWTDWQGENITFNQVVYALYERDTETIFDARIPLAGGYISNVGDCFD